MNRYYDAAQPERYGFEFGAARVTRIAHVEGRYHVLGVDTPWRHCQIAVSPTGKNVRVWIDDKEITASPAPSSAGSETKGGAGQDQSGAGGERT